MFTSFSLLGQVFTTGVIYLLPLAAMLLAADKVMADNISVTITLLAVWALAACRDVIGSAGFLAGWAAFALAATSVSFIKLFSGMNLYGPEIAMSYGVYTIIYCGACFRLGSITGTAGPMPKFMRLIARLLLIVPLTAAIFLWAAFAAVGYLLTDDSILALVQTNFAEAAAFAASLPFWRLPLALAVAALGVAFMVFFLRRLEEMLGDYHIIYTDQAALSVLLAFGLMIHFGSPREIYPVNVGKSVRNAVRTYRAFAATAAQRAARLDKLGGLAIAPQGGGVHVVVIGEALTRDHMSLYGYKRPTTPKLAALAADAGVTVLGNAYACHTTTLNVLNYALTQSNQYNGINLAKAFSLGDIAKKAGYKLAWLSNQSPYSRLSEPWLEVAYGADQAVWLNRDYAQNMSPVPDGKLADALTEIEKSPNMLIVVHLMGEHWDYADKYPAEFELFADENETVADYDNAVRYTDHVVAELYREAKKIPGFRSFVFFADHGEEPDLQRGHDSGRFTWQMVRIPMIVALGDDYRRVHPAKAKALAANRNRPWTNDLLYDLLTDLMGIDGVPDVEPRRDILSPEYSLDFDTGRTLHDKKSLAEDLGR